MPKYTQRVRFSKDFTIEAKNAEEANALLEEAIDDIEFDTDLTHDGYYSFEDEPVKCPQCGGNGMIGEDGCETECPVCKGNGEVEFDHPSLSK